MQEGFARLPENVANAISEVSLTSNFKRKLDRNTRSRNMANAIREAIKNFCLRDRSSLKTVPKVVLWAYVISQSFRFKDPVLAEFGYQTLKCPQRLIFSVILIAFQSLV